MKLNGKIWALAVVLSVGASITGAYAVGMYLKNIYRSVLPDVTVAKTQFPISAGKDGKRNLYRFTKTKPRHWVTLQQVPKKTIAAILTAEDAGFYRHEGFDPKAMREAWEYNHQPGVKIKRGGSTITQQVVKNLFLSPEKTITRKIRELVLAVQLENELPKNKILELYLNIAEWGSGVYGIEQASKRYFGKSTQELTVRESAILAFMLPNPLKYQNSYRNGELSQFGKDRVEDILNRMHRMGYLSDEEYASDSARKTETEPTSISL